MKRIKLFLPNIIILTATVLSTLAANRSCTWFLYQSELPDAVKLLRKF